MNRFFNIQTELKAYQLKKNTPSRQSNAMQNPPCGPAQSAVRTLTNSVSWLHAELNRTPPDPQSVADIQTLITNDVTRLVNGLSGYIVAGCCEPHLKNLEQQVLSMQWVNTDSISQRQKNRLIQAIQQAQLQARRDYEHC